MLDHAGAEPAIVAMHGFPDDLHIYDYLVGHLAPRRVVTFDWLGYGRSARRQGGSFNPADRQRDLTAVLDGLGLDQVVLVGHDASGPEAVDFALAHPGRVRAVVLLNTYYGHDPALRFPEMIALMADPAYRALTDALVGDELQRLWLLQHSGRQMGLDPGDPAGIGTASIVPQFFGGEAGPDALAEIRAWTADLPNALDRQDRRITASAGLSAVVYGVIEGQRYSWSAVSSWLTIPEIITVGVVALAVFAVWEHRHGEPLVPLGLFRSRQFAILVALNLLVQFALQSMLLANAINWQSVLGMTAVLAGLTSLPLTLALTALAPFAGRLTDRLGGRYVLMAGLAVYAAGIAGVAMVSTTHATSLTFAPVLLLGGLGMGAIFAPLATEAMRAAPVHLAGAASGVLNTARQLGGTLGSAITGAVLAVRLTSAMEQRAHAVAQTLPPPARALLIGGFANAAKTGLQVGRGQAAASLPDSTPAQLVPYLHRVIRDIFGTSYIAALHPALAISVAALLAGAAACPLLRRSTAPALAERPATGGPGA